MHVSASWEGAACADYTSVMLIGRLMRGVHLPSLSPTAGRTVIGAESHAETESRAAVR